MVNGLFFCTTLTGRRGGHTPSAQAGAETSDTSADVVKPGHTELGTVIPRVGASVGNESVESVESCGVVCPLRIPLVTCLVHHTYVVGVR